jgi:probable rRNA maturation factor
VRRAIHALDASAQFRVPPGELSLVVLDAAAMGRVHADFLDDPSPTDVITFDGDPAFGEAGEVCVCADVARDYAAEHAGPRPALQRRMRAAERRAMALLDAAGIAVDTLAAWR